MNYEYTSQVAKISELTQKYNLNSKINGKIDL